MSLLDLLNAAADAKLQSAYHDALASGLKAAAIGEAERLRSTHVPVRELNSDQGLGALRLDNDGKPAVPVIDKPEETASWLAQVEPALVQATISVPVDKLEEALEALGYAGIAGPHVTAKVESRDPDATARWLAAHCKVQADPQMPGAWNVLHVDAEGHTALVPGASAVRPSPYWVIKTNDDLRAANVATAQSEVEELVRQLREADAADREAGEQAAGAGQEPEHAVQELAHPIGS